MSGHNPKTTRSFIDSLEETMIAIMLGIMTLVTFANVMARYVFNSNILWGLEVTSILFAWLVLFGVSYCVKKTAHLGVDAIMVASQVVGALQLVPDRVPGKIPRQGLV